MNVSVNRENKAIKWLLAIAIIVLVLGGIYLVWKYDTPPKPGAEGPIDPIIELKGKVTQQVFERNVLGRGAVALKAVECEFDENVEFDVVKLESLEIINLDSSRLTSTQFASLINLPKVTMISLARSNVTDKVFNRLGRDSMIEHINLDGTDIGIATIRKLQRMKRLKRLYLSHVSIDDSVIDELLKIPSIEELWVANTEITELGKERLIRQIGTIE